MNHNIPYRVNANNKTNSFINVNVNANVNDTTEKLFMPDENAIDEDMVEILESENIENDYIQNNNNLNNINYDESNDVIMSDEIRLNKQISQQEKCK